MINIALAGQPSPLLDRVSADVARDPLLNVIVDVSNPDIAGMLAGFQPIDVIVLCLKREDLLETGVLLPHQHNLIVFCPDTFVSKNTTYLMFGPFHYLNGLFSTPEFALDIRRAAFPIPPIDVRDVLTRSPLSYILSRDDVRRLDVISIQAYRNEIKEFLVRVEAFEASRELPEDEPEIDSIIQSSKTYKRLRARYKRWRNRDATDAA